MSQPLYENSYRFHYRGFHQCMRVSNDGERRKKLAVIPYAGFMNARSQVLMWRTCWECGGKVGLKMGYDFHRNRKPII
jgi:hypothetical protein